MPRFQDTEAERRVRRLKVVGYTDLRPIDWFTGKRVPLTKGEGNICDRCGAEHAIVFTLADLDTREQWKVGSGCAKRAFGFDPEKDVEAKRLVKASEREANQRRVKELEELIESHVRKLVPVVGAIPMPPIKLADSKPFAPGSDKLSEKWAMGDAYQWRHAVTPGKPLDRDTEQTIMRSWALKRALELAPSSLKNAGDKGHAHRKVAEMASWRLVMG
jgi:hypothetical protein